jgi:hypothetical protein
MNAALLLHVNVSPQELAAARISCTHGAGPRTRKVFETIARLLEPLPAELSTLRSDVDHPGLDDARALLAEVLK